MTEINIHTIKSCIAGDRKSQKRFFLTYNKILFAVAMKYMGNRNDAEEVLQDSWLNIFKSLESYKDEGKLEGWLKTIVIRTAWKQRSKKKFYSELDHVADLTNDSANSQAIDKMTCEEILKLLEYVPIASQQVFKMFVLDQYNHTEISEILGINKATSRSHLAKARKVLKKRFEILNQVHNGLRAI